jgi:hypothetical protein
MAASLGAGFMAVLHELARWDANRRLAGQLGGQAPAAAAPPGRHARDDVDLLGDGFRAGLAARDVAPVTADPAGHGWQRPSTMVPPGELLERPLPDGPPAGPPYGTWRRPAAAIAEDIAVWQHTWAPEGTRVPAQVSWDLS